MHVNLASGKTLVKEFGFYTTVTHDYTTAVIKATNTKGFAIDLDLRWNDEWSGALLFSKVGLQSGPN